MSPLGNCEVCLTTFHYSEASDLTHAMDMAGLNAPDICMYCEQEIRNAPIVSATVKGDDPADAYANPNRGI